MINPETGHPFTRRELREREKSGATTVVASPPPETTPDPPQQPETIAEPPPAEHSASSDVPQFWPEAPVLTRRQRREREQTETGSTGTPPAEVVSTAAPVADEATRELAGLSEAVPPSQPVAQEPLPPVFAPVLDASPASTEASSMGLARGPGDPLRATSSLILPTTPGADLTGPLGDTGEIVVTGDIRLPSHFSVQGTAPFRLDSDIEDDVMDSYVTGEIGALSQPVSARHAVSGRSKDSDIRSIRKTRWGTGTVITLLVLGTLTLAAIGLVVLSVTTGVLL